MRLRQIEIFHAVYTTGSVTNAAKKLYVSQPSVSKVLAHAEQQLGFQLFSRIKGRLVPTKEADLLFEEVNRIYSQLNNLKSTAENIKSVDVGNLEIAVTPALGFDVIPSACMAFKQQHTKLKFNIQTIHSHQLLNHLNRHQSELAIMFASNKFSGINEIEIGKGNLVAVYCKNLIPKCPKFISLKNLLKYPLLGIDDSGPLADIVWREMIKNNLRPVSEFKVQTYFIAVNLIRKGAGVCIVDEFTARGQKSENIGIAKLNGDFSFPIKALHLENKPLSRIAVAFIKQLKQQLKKESKV